MYGSVITFLQGGLGNQMFQYAAGRSLALRHGMELKLDRSWFEGSASIHPPRRFMLDVFPQDHVFSTEEERRALEGKESLWRHIILRRILRRPGTRYAAAFIREPHYAYWSGFESLPVPAYLAGYWQSERYFASVAADIRRDFTFPALPHESVGLADSIRETRDSVAVHVRCGDYCSNPLTNKMHGLCPPEYYSRALDAIASSAGGPLSLFIFSDEPNWARENFDCRGNRATFVNFPAHMEAPWHDMYLMSLCCHHITANSSFSWWGAWLSGEKGVVCCPERWFMPESGMEGHPGPERWVRL